ncbi:MAG: hypothetical protein JSW33_08745 [bacterium]|nr:MAG: hypothetical protein JSW33_08745 [bacterium]
MIRKSLFLLKILLLICYATAQDNKELQPYIDALNDKGEDPLTFILEKFEHFDLILFDDGLHNAVEPFEFYQKLIKSSEFNKKAKYIFLEAVSVNQQPALDAYFNSDTNDIKLLYPAFQNDFSGTGWSYKTYFDLLQTIWIINSKLPVEDRFKVIPVNAPTYWKQIVTSTDLELFRLSLVGNDYTMYKIILTYLENFESGLKGIFLTNTRHSYKRIRNSQNKNYWNCGTFFHLNHPQKTYSVRLHNISFSFTKKKEIDPKIPKTTQGLEKVIVNWVRMEKGLWDTAFKTVGNNPVAFDLKDTPFGEAEYIGNHMLDVANGQTIFDAYDGLIFLAPLEVLRQTAMADYIYTDEYKIELERRLQILYTEEQIEEILKENDVKSIREYIDNSFTFRPEVRQPLTKMIGAIDEWKIKD